MRACPPIVSVPPRLTPLVFAVLLNPIIAEPLPAPLDDVSHAALLVVLHPHPRPAVTITTPEPAAAGSAEVVASATTTNPLAP